MPYEDSEVLELTGAVNSRVVFPILLSGDLVQSPEHLGPAYLTAVLRAAGATVTTIEVPSGLPRAKSQALRAIVQFRPSIVGLSLTNVAVEESKTFGQKLRDQLGPEVFFVAGGPLATHLGASLLELDDWLFLDGLIRGEGEVPIVRLAAALQAGRALSDVPALIYRDGTDVVEQPIVPAHGALDTLPFPERDQLAQMGTAAPYARISTSRGCTAHCTFCNAPHARNRVGPRIKAWRGRSPENVVDEIDAIVTTYGTNTFDFVDSTFEDPGGGRLGKARIGEIADHILNRDLNIFFNVCMQARNWTEADWPLLEKLRRAGLEKVLVGIESGSETGLARWQKKSTVADNERVLELLRRLGVYTAFGFIAFHPWTTFAEFRENTAFLQANAGHNLRRYTTRLELYPGSEVIDELAAEGLLHKDYFQTLKIFAYEYKDQRIAALANAFNALYGARYLTSGSIDAEPPVFKYETYDIEVHNFTTRLHRLTEGDDTGRAIMAQFETEVADVRAGLTAFNRDFVGTATDRAESAEPLQLGLHARALLDDTFESAMREIDRLKLKTGLALHRHGIKVSQIAAKHIERKAG